MDFLEFAHPGVRTLKPYLPGKPIKELKRELKLQNVIKLASNENPFGASKLALQAIHSSLSDLALYPDASGYELKKALSLFYNISSEQITLGNGSNEIFDLVIRSFATTHHEIIISQYGFIAFKILGQVSSAKIITVPEIEYKQDLNATLNAINEKTRLIFIANPNNPTGSWHSENELLQFLKNVPNHVLVILDEAYVDFIQEDPFYSKTFNWLLEFPNLIITRTFSKAYGLAGLRIGFGVSNPHLAELMNRVRQPFNVNHLAMVAASAALNDTEHLVKTIQNNKMGMKQWICALQVLGLEYIPSGGNFVTIDLKQEAEPLYQQLLNLGIIVRPLKSYNMPNHLRISIGLPEENERAIHSLKKVLENSYV